MIKHNHMMSLRHPNTSTLPVHAGPARAGFRPVIFFLFPALLLAALPLRVAARSTTAPEARQAVQTWLGQDPRPLGARLSQTLDKVEAFNEGTSETVYYVASLAPEGFIVVAGDDLVEPIIAFSPIGHFNGKTPNPMLSLVRHDVSNRVGRARQHQKSPRAKGQRFAPAEHEARAQAKWSRLAGTTATAPPATAAHTASVSDLRVAPLVQSQWDQANIDGYINGKSCYNYYTPPGSSG